MPPALTYLNTGKRYLGEPVRAVPALLCGVAAAILLELLPYHWEKRQAKYSLEWFPGMLAFLFASSPQDRRQHRLDAQVGRYRWRMRRAAG